MQIIYEYHLTMKTILQLPANAKPLCLRWDKQDNLVMQVLQVQNAPKVTRCFVIHKVGGLISGRVCYVGTIVNADEQVLHVFEELAPTP